MSKLTFNGVGIGQKWQSVFASRAAATNYTNTTGAPITVSVSATLNAAYGTAIIYVGAVIAAFASAGATPGDTFGLSAVVPVGEVYRVDIGGAGALATWGELR